MEGKQNGDYNDKKGAHSNHDSNHFLLRTLALKMYFGLYFQPNNNNNAIKKTLRK